MWLCGRAGGFLLPSVGRIIHARTAPSTTVIDRAATVAAGGPPVLRAACEQAIARGEGPERSFITLGYAGWGAGQLEEELAANAWLSGPADTAIVFETPYDQRWEAAAALIGVDLTLISGEAGHA